MTLVLSLLTRDAAIQVSDRRITRSDGAVTDDNRNKALVFEGATVFGYSGLAKIAGLNTDIWLALLLGNAQPTDPFPYVATEAANAMHGLALSGDIKRLAFIAIGWRRDDANTDYLPIITIVTNAMRKDGSWLPTADDAFSIMEWKYQGHLGDPDFVTGPAVGASVSDDVAIELQRRLEDATARRVRPITLARILAEAIRKTAGQNLRVGKELVAVIVPKPKERPSQRLVTTAKYMVATSSAVECYLMQESPTEEMKWVMPSWVANGCVITDCEYEKTGSRNDKLTARIWRVGSTGGFLVMGSPEEGIEMQFGILANGQLQTRVIRPGIPDEIQNHGPIASDSPR